MQPDRDVQTPRAIAVLGNGRPGSGHAANHGKDYQLIENPRKKGGVDAGANVAASLAPAPSQRKFSTAYLDTINDGASRVRLNTQAGGSRSSLLNSPRLPGTPAATEALSHRACRRPGSIAASAIGRASAVCRSGVRTRAVGTRPQIRRSESKAASQRGREGRPGRAAAVCDLHLNTPPRLAAARCDGDQRMGQGGNVHRMLSGGAEGGDQGAYEGREEGVGATRRRACRTQQPATRGRTCTWSCACAWAAPRPPRI